MTYQAAMKHPVVAEAIRSWGAVDWIVEEGVYLFSDGEWGPYRVLYELLDDLVEELGVELTWQFIRHGTTPDECCERKLVASGATVRRWKEAIQA